MRSRPARLLLIGLAVAGLAAACGDDDDSDVAATTTAPEDVKAPADEVAAGLKELDQLAKDAAAAVEAGKSDEAVELADEVHETWEGVEGTIKDNDEDAYIAFEDAIAALQSAADEGDAAKATDASADISAAVTSYLEAYPG